MGFEQQQGHRKTKQILAFRKLFYYIVYNIIVLVHECFMTCMLRVRRQLVGVAAFHHEGSGAQAQIIRLGVKPFTH